MRKSSHQGIYRLWVVIISLIIILVLSISLVRYLQREEDNRLLKKAQKYENYNHIREVEKHAGGPPVKYAGNIVAILIDDIGWDRDIVEELLDIDAPISFSILPHLPLSGIVAEEINRSGRDILLHLPMEPYGYPDVDPGIGAIISNMTTGDMEYELTKDINSVPYIIGINNHMGSKLTEDEYIMRVILKMIRENDLFFIDSITSSRTVAFKVAKELGLKTAQRKLFLDNTEDIDYINRQIMRLGEIAKKDGSAIGIGHPYKVTAAALREMIPKLREEGIEVVPISIMMEYERTKSNRVK